MEQHIESRIELIQKCHTWLLETEARHLLISVYAALTRFHGMDGQELKDEMDSFVESICGESRGKVIRLLQQTGGLVA